MAQILDLLPENPELASDLFATEEDYSRFREEYVETVSPELEKWMEARRRSEEDARQRILR